MLAIYLLIFLFSSAKPVSALDNLEPEIIYPQSSNVCAQFPIDAEVKSETPLNSVSEFPQEEDRRADGQASGDLKLNKDQFPDFEQMQKDLERAIPWLTPQELLDHLSITGPSLKTKAKHFVMGSPENGGEALIPPSSSEKIPETEITQPEWFTQLLGNSRWLCGIYGTCPAAKSPIIKVEQAQVNISNEAYQNNCLLAEPKIPEQEADPRELQTQFTVLSWWNKIVRVVEKVVDETYRYFVRKDEQKTQLTVKTQGDLAGGSNFAVYSDFQKEKIPQEMMEEWDIKTGSLATKDNNYNISINSNAQDYQEPINYSDKVKEQIKRCMFICSLYPAEFDISSIDPICPSCDIKDYQLQYIPVDNITNCNLTSTGCDYCIPIGTNGIGPSCEGDPVCEGEDSNKKCCPNQYRQAEDYQNIPGCSPPYPAPNCNLREICIPMTFKKNSDNSFGPCKYQNPNVCVRADWIEGGVGKCDHLCNWACCDNQN